MPRLLGIREAKGYDGFSRDFCYNDVISVHPGLHRSLRGNPSRLTSNIINLIR